MKTKATIVSLLVLQTSFVSLATRQSRIFDKNLDPNVAVLVAEFLKFVISFSVYIVTEAIPASKTSVKLASRKVRQEVFGLRNLLVVSVPAALYLLQNNLQLRALSYLDSFSFQVLNQLKIFTTAIFSFLILRKSLSIVQWASLIILTAGVTLVSVDKSDQANLSNLSLTGVYSAVIACCISALAGVYFEYVLKSSAESIWVRNTQLAFLSCWTGLISNIFFNNWSHFSLEKILSFHTWTWCSILGQVVGGFLVASVVKLADSIIKNFATSVSIVVSALIGFLFLDVKLTLFSSLGAMLVISATWMYNFKSKRKMD